MPKDTPTTLGEVVRRPDWQRPPFERGNTAGARHGAYSPKITGARAQLVAEEFLAENPQYAVPELAQLVGLLCRAIAREQLAHEAAEEGNLSPRLLEVAASTTRTAKEILTELGNGLRSAAELRDIQAKTALTVATLAQQAPAILEAVSGALRDLELTDRADEFREAFGRHIARIAGAE